MNEVLKNTFILIGALAIIFGFIFFSVKDFADGFKPYNALCAEKGYNYSTNHYKDTYCCGGKILADGGVERTNEVCYKEEVLRK